MVQRSPVTRRQIAKPPDRHTPAKAAATESKMRSSHEFGIHSRGYGLYSERPIA